MVSKYLSKNIQKIYNEIKLKNRSNEKLAPFLVTSRNKMLHILSVSLFLFFCPKNKNL